MGNRLGGMKMVIKVQKKFIKISKRRFMSWWMKLKQRSAEFYKNGKRNGSCVWWDEDGHKTAEENWLNDLKRDQPPGSIKVEPRKKYLIILPENAMV